MTEPQTVIGWLISLRPPNMQISVRRPDYVQVDGMPTATIVTWTRDDGAKYSQMLLDPMLEYARYPEGLARAILAKTLLEFEKDSPP